MPRSFLVYWLPEQIQSSITDGYLDHAASDQFSRINSGDTLWITGKTASDPLITIGPLHVAEVVGQKEASRRLPYRPWPAKYHALCIKNQPTQICQVSLAPILEDLRFVSKSNKLNHSKPFGLQLQAMRELTEASARLLQKLWQDETNSTLVQFEGIQNSLDSYDNLDKEVTAFSRLEQNFLRKYLFMENEKGTCAICGRELPTPLLVAAHIKPRSKCSDAERRDYANNVIPMYLIGCDALFERGFVSIRNGKVAIHRNKLTCKELRNVLNELNGQPTFAWREGRIMYFNWHHQFWKTKQIESE